MQVVTLTSTFPDLDVTLFEDDESEFYTGFVGSARTVVAEGLGVPWTRLLSPTLYRAALKLYTPSARRARRLQWPCCRNCRAMPASRRSLTTSFRGCRHRSLPVEAVVAEVVYIMPGVVDADIFGCTTAMHDVVNQTDLDGGDSYVLNMDPDAWSGFPQYRVYFDEHTVEARIALSFTDPGFQTAEVQKLPSADDDGANASLTFSLADASSRRRYRWTTSATSSLSPCPTMCSQASQMSRYTVTIIRAGETDGLSAGTAESEVIDQDFQATASSTQRPWDSTPPRSR